MDLILSSRPQTLISTISLPSPSHFRLSSSFRREFFGCGNHSRLHGSRPRRRCRKLRFPRYSSPQCLSQDFPDPVLVVAVAFVAFTALQVIYLYLSRRRREAAEVSTWFFLLFFHSVVITFAVYGLLVVCVVVELF